MRVSLFDFMLLVNFQIETTPRVAGIPNGMDWMGNIPGVLTGR